MIKALFKILFLGGVLSAVLLGLYSYENQQTNGQDILSLPEAKERIILLPLDSRPPCRKLVIDNGRTAGIEVIVPPDELMDYYTRPGNTQALADWLDSELENSSSAIISIDQLLYGGLIASREKQLTSADIAGLRELLLSLHEKHSGKKLYCFSIAPRMNPPASMDSYQDINHLMHYSRLADRIALYDDISDREAMLAVSSELSPELIQDYCERFARNYELNLMLSELASKGVIQELFIGQDDGEQYSIPNMYLRMLKEELGKRDIKNNVIIFHGADEAALSILARIYIKEHPASRDIRPAIDFTSDDDAEAILPYMAIGLKACAEERLDMMGLQEAGSPDEAEFTLLIHAGSSAPAKEKLSSSCALVDITRHFTMQEALLPKLLPLSYPINSLYAYAGWNTASNSIGTALAQAVIFRGALKEAATEEEALAIYHSNVINLNNRFLEDCFYLKDGIDHVNQSLASMGYDGRYTVLDPSFTLGWAQKVLDARINSSVYTLMHSQAYRASFEAEVPNGIRKLGLDNLRCTAYFPWPRTFEIWLDSQPQMKVLP